MSESDGLRERIEAALNASMDRCARCKTCDVQVDAVMGVIAEDRKAAETEWGLNIGGAAGLTPYDENVARRVVQMLQENGVPVGLYRREVGPWTPAPEVTVRDEREEGNG